MNKPTVKEQTVTDSSGSRPAIAPLNPKQAALVLIALFVAVSVYVAIGIMFGLTALFAGSLLLFFWAGIEHFKLNALLPTLLLHWLPHVFNQAYMLMLTVTLAPPIMAEGSFVAMGIAAVYSAAFWGCLTLLVSALRSRRVVTGPD